MIKGEPWFLASDVTEILGLGNPRDAIARHIDKDDRDGVGIPDAIGREQKTTVVNESGLYSLIFGSTKPEAKRFKHRVTKEVLPEIRRTGQYTKDVSPWLSSDPSQWHKTFPDAYFLQIFRLKGKRPPKDGNLKYTPWISHINNDLIYKRLDVGVSEALKPNRGRGICIEYETRWLSIPEAIGLLHPVNYHPELFDVTEYFRSLPQDYNNWMLWVAACHKSPEWAYEHEWRYIDVSFRDSSQGLEWRSEGDRFYVVISGVEMSKSSFLTTDGSFLIGLTCSR
jgi:BRO family, N-terminal domain/P63C domain